MENWIVWVAVMLAILATSTAGASLRKSKELERKMRAENLVDIVKIKNILIDNINKYVEFELFDDVIALGYQKALLLDVDDEWALLKIEKKKKSENVLVRIDNIISIKVSENNA